MGLYPSMGRGDRKSPIRKRVPGWAIGRMATGLFHVPIRFYWATIC